MKAIRSTFVPVLWLLAAAACLSSCGNVSVSKTGDEPAGRASAESSQAKTRGERYDLTKDEERGGHTVKKHVGRTDDELRERLERERDISAASTWTDLATAEETVAAALRDQSRRIEQWEERGFPRSNLALHYDAGRPIGRSLRHGETQSVPCTSAVIVLKADGPRDFFVLTTYPEARE